MNMRRMVRAALLITAGTSGFWHTSVAVADSTPPLRPQWLMAIAASPSQINLSWSESTDFGGSGLAGYKIERCQGSGCTTYTQIATTTTAAYSNTGLAASTFYRYRVRAYDGAGNNSLYSNISNETTPADTQAPTTPAGLSAAAVSSLRVDLSWTAATDNVGVVSYLIERCMGDGCSSFASIGSAAASPYSDAGLTAATAYRYRIRAADASGNISAYSGIASTYTWASGNGVIYRYDSQGHLMSTIDSSGRVVQYTYDPAGHVNGIQSTP